MNFLIDNYYLFNLLLTVTYTVILIIYTSRLDPDDHRTKALVRLLLGLSAWAFYDVIIQRAAEELSPKTAFLWFRSLSIMWLLVGGLAGELVLSLVRPVRWSDRLWLYLPFLAFYLVPFFRPEFISARVYNIRAGYPGFPGPWQLAFRTYWMIYMVTLSSFLVIRLRREPDPVARRELGLLAAGFAVAITGLAASRWLLTKFGNQVPALGNLMLLPIPLTAFLALKYYGRVLSPKQLYLATVETIPTGIVHLRNDRIQWANRAAARIFGVRPGQADGKIPWTRFVGRTEEVDRIRGLLETVLREGRAVSDEVELVSYTGHPIPCMTNLALLDRNDPEQGMFVTLTDIRIRQRAEAALRKSSRLFRALAESIPTGLLVVQGGRVRYANPSALTLGGLTLESLGEISSEALLHEVHPALLETVRKVEESGSVLNRSGELTLAIGDEERQWLDYTITPIEYEGREALLALFVDVSRRKRTEEALRASQAQLAAMIDTAAVGIAVYDPEIRFTRINTAWSRMTGYSEEEVLGHRDHDFSDPDDPGVNGPQLKDLLEGRRDSYRREKRYRAKDGTWFWGDITVTAMRRPSGEVDSVMAILQDISERKKVESELRESETRFRTVVETSEACIMIFQDDTWVYANPAVTRVTGYTFEELREMGPEGTVHPDQREVAGERVRTRPGGDFQADRTEVMVQAKDGRTIWFDQRMVEIEYEGRPAFLSVAIDITERKESHELLALRADYERALAGCSARLLQPVQATEGDPLDQALRQLLEAVRACRIYIYENYRDEAGELCYRPAAEVVRSGVDEILAREKGLRMPYRGRISHWREVFTQGGHVSGLIKDFPRAEREILEAQSIRSILVLPIFVQGRWDGYIGFDDTREEREWLDQDILLLRTAADILGSFFERQRSEADLREALDRAEEASRAKSEFLAIVSHEIRTPLNAIMGMAEVLAETPLTPEQVRFVETSRNAGEGLLTIINDVLDLSKVEAGRLELESRRFDLGQIVDETCQVMALRAADKGLEFTWGIIPGTPRKLVGDPVRLRQILVNLIGNAIKFTTRGEVEVLVGRIDVSGADDPEVFELGISVEDTGIGIEPDQLEQIFQPFVQADSSASRRFGGTGLGLSISTSLAEMMDGRIAAFSRPQVGSRFIFTARFKTGPRESAERFMTRPALTDPERLRGLAEAAAGLPPMKILMADDSEANRILVKAFLEDTRVDLIMAVNGREAIRLFKNGTFDLVLMDIQMPVMDGFKATAEIRAYESDRRLAPTPLLAMTAFAHEREAAKCLAAGANLHLAKPISKARLLEAIYRHGLDQEPPLSVAAGRPESETAPMMVTVDPDLAPIIPTFLELMADQAALARQALMEDRPDEIRLIGHQLKGEGRAYGFDELSEIGEELQAATEEADRERLEELLNRLEEYLNRVSIRT